MTALAALAAALAFDWLWGDPTSWPHPVRALGRWVSLWERTVRRRAVDRKDRERFEVLWGGVGWITTVFLVGGAVWATLVLVGLLSSAARWVLSTYWLYTGLAAGCLDREARTVQDHLEVGDLAGARERLAGLVGRDTACLSEPDVVRATVETVAENASDGAVAPLFWAGLGALVGLAAPALWAYKAVNTMDSMVGYRNETYRCLGRIPARADDLFNWIPARLTALLMVLAAGPLGFSRTATLETARRDGAKHLSPNAGWPEAAMAGALSIKLGGTHRYAGITVEKPELGDGDDLPTARHIAMARSFLWPVTLWAALCLAPLWLVR